jgi:hypothetical protein
MSPFPAANTGSLDVQLWLHARFVQEGWRERHVAPQRAPDQVARLSIGRADMRLTCGPPVVVCVWEHLQLLLTARGPPKTSSEPRRGRGIVFRNSRISLSAVRRACEPAAKPAIPGVILVHNGFVWPERTPPPLEAHHHPQPFLTWALRCPGSVVLQFFVLPFPCSAICSK